MPKLNIKFAIDNLSGDTIDCKPIKIDWQEARGENGEGWRSYEAAECDKCGAVLVLDCGGNERHQDIGQLPEECEKCGGVEMSYPVVKEIDGEDVRGYQCDDCGEFIVDPTACDGFVRSAEGPMMNYWYPVEISDCTKAARKLAHLPLCVVEFEDGQTGLALTGGGMDLSWEICEAFIALGKMPPVHFSDLPGMAGTVLDEKNKLIVAACIKSNEVQRGWATRRIKQIKHVAVEMRKNARKAHP